MSTNDDQEELKATTTPGYKPSAVKSVEEYANLDAEDESLARWKASLGITPGTTASTANGPKLTVLTLELMSSSLPSDKKITLNLQNQTEVADTKKNPIIIKEGVEYNVRITFKVNHSIVTGLRYIQLVKRAGIKGNVVYYGSTHEKDNGWIVVDRLEQMLGSYSPREESYTKDFDSEEAPTGMIVRSGSYTVKSRVIDDDEKVYADWEWSFKLAKEW